MTLVVIGAIRVYNRLLYILHGSCADAGIFVTGGPGQSDKKSSDVFYLFFFSPHLILLKSNG